MSKKSICLIFLFTLSFLIWSSINFFEAIIMIGLLYVLYLIDLKKISEKILFGSPATIKIGL